MRKATFFASLLLLALATSLCLSQTGVRESFEYTLGLKLDSLGTAGSGWAAGWWGDTTCDAHCVFVADTGTDYNSIINYPIHNKGHKAVGTVVRGWWGTRYSRYLAQQWTNTLGKHYWLSFAHDLKNNTVNCWSVVSLWDSTYETVGAPHGWGNDTVIINGINNCPRTPISTQNGPEWYVMRFDMKGPVDTTMRVFLWVSPNPDGSAPDTSTAISKGTFKFAQHTYSKVTGLDSLPVKIHNGFNCVHMEYSNSVDLVGEAMFDEIRLDTSWAKVSGALTGVDDKRGNAQPSEFELVQNYPNPFNPTTQINYAVPQSGYITLKVYNLLGQQVATLFEGVRSVGNYQITFNASNLPSGVYFTRLQAGSVSITKKMLLMK